MFCCLFHKHENLYVRNQGHLWYVTLWRVFVSFRWMQKHCEQWCAVPGTRHSYLSPPAAVVRNCTCNSSIYCTCLQKTFFPPFYTHSPQAWGTDSMTLHILDSRTTQGKWFLVTAGPTSQNLFAYSLCGSGGCYSLRIVKPYLLQPPEGATNPTVLSQCPAPQLGKPLTKKRRSAPTLWSCDWWTWKQQCTDGRVA